MPREMRAVDLFCGAGGAIKWETLAKAFFEHSRSRPGRENALVPQDDCAAVSALIHDQARSIAALTARVAELEGAIRKFPHFENDEPITVEAISKVAGEHVDMIMSWVPVQTKIAFVDDGGRQFEIVYEDGDSDAGIPSGWCVPEDADWQPARRGIESELAAARKVEDGEVASYALRLHTIANHALDPSPARDDLHYAADLLTRLSAALKAANDRADKEEDLRKGSDEAADELVTAWKHRAQAAEAKLESARRDALEEAAKLVELQAAAWARGASDDSQNRATTLRFTVDAIRALQTKDTQRNERATED